MEKPRLSRPKIYRAGIGVLIATIFSFDAVTPENISVGILYVAPLYLAGWLPHRSEVWIIAFIVTILNVLGFFLSPPAGSHVASIWNTAFAGLTILITASFMTYQRRLRTEIRRLEGLLPLCSACKKIRTDGGEWHEIEHYIEERSDALFSHGICPECTKKLYPDFADRILGTTIARRE